MRIRHSGLALIIGLSVVLTACEGTLVSPAPSTSPSTASTGGVPASPSSASTAVTSDLQIAVVTDAAIDKDSQEPTVIGAQQGAEAIGAGPPTIVAPTSEIGVAPLIGALVAQGFDIIVTTGPEAIPAVVAMAKANKGIWFIGVDQVPCVGAAGAHDPAGVCAADIAKILPRYIAITYAEDQAGYLAGVVAASVTRSGVIGAIGGMSTCGPCVKYMQGYILGAKSVMPTAKVKTGFVSVNDARLGFSDQLAGNTYATAFIKANAGLDVLFQVADRTDVGGLTGNGIIDAACAAGIDVIGVDVDQHQAYPASQACILTSAEKSVSASVSASIAAIAAMTAVGGLTTYNAANDGISISPFYTAADKLQAGTDARIAAALGAMKAGSLVTCPPSRQCGKTPAPKLGD